MSLLLVVNQLIMPVEFFAAKIAIECPKNDK
jgi:hypothetical protein